MLFFRYLDRLDNDPLAALIFFGALVTALVVGISFHEFSHAYVADSMGDSLPRSRGRVTLNPLAHLDPAGTIFLFLVGFGWGKPVPVNPNVSNNPKAMMAIVAGAGPVSNFLVAALAGLPLQLGLVEWLSPFNFAVLDRFLFVGFGFDEYLGLYLSAIVLISIILGVFNLLPIFPLDGHRVIPAFLSDQAAHTYMQFQSRYGFIILIALIALPFLTGGQFGVLFEVMSPIINVLARLFAGIDEDVFG
ncbi:MAG: site-2 protease family protein [Chloroflexi bacterium]|nr:site-2 protease family protein [Chloroflexota bacterium]